MKRGGVLLVAAAVAVITGGAALFASVERLPFTTGLYWAIVTAGTVGYGDVAPRTPHGRLIAVAVILIAVPLLGGVYTRMAGAHIRRKLSGDLGEIRDTAEKAHRIAADTYHHHTGRDHPDAPSTTTERRE